MVAIKALTVLALAGSISAAPTQTVGEAVVRRQWSGWGAGAPQGNWNGGERWKWSWGGQQGSSDDSSAPAAAPAAAPSAQPSSPPVTSGQTSAGADQPAGGSYGGGQSQPSAQPSAQPSSPPTSGGSSGGSGYMAIVSEWRTKMGLPDFTESSELQANALNTAQSSGGQLIHKLNPGTMAQVLAPGNANNFQSVFVGGWLCEMPQLPGLGSSVCNSESQGWNHAGQTGHAEILSSTKYTEIGCALADGIWACDLN